MEFLNKNILIISTEAWGNNHITKHHYAKELAKLGNQVYFLNPASQKFKVANVLDNLTVIDYKPKFRGLNRMPSLLRNTLNKIELKSIYKLAGITKLDLVWSFDPFRFQNLKLFKAQKAIYYPADVHQIALEPQTADTADVVVSITPSILDRLAVNTPKKLIHHALGSSFAAATELFPLQEKQNKPIQCGYVGNLNSKYLDTAAMQQIIADNPAVEFHIMGPYKANDNNLGKGASNAELITFLEQQKHVKLYGSVAPTDLAKLIHQFDMFLLCYNADKFRQEVSNSHKFMEYLSTGKVTVANHMIAFESYQELLEMTDTQAELPYRFKSTLKELSKHNSLSLQQKRRTFSLSNTYTNQVKKIETFLA
ncbi:MAG: glycosyltransferase family 1 protein [Aureispira sp.]|nr:glycosyltransferase family 1 protein [Aureispira sp.]